MDAKGFWTAVLAASVAKLLMLKSYRSTDFEVHRNWLAITHTLPLEKWYYEETSEWTLDYPPFFAYFEWILSHGAKYFDEKMLLVENLNYASNMTILYQKLSVIATDFILAYGVFECSRTMDSGGSKAHSSNQDKYLLQLFALIFLNGGLFLVDHIHFQYNGFLFGVLLLAIAKLCKGKCYQGAFLFASLLCLKHIFLYMAPAFGIFLLRTQCINRNAKEIWKSINFVPLISFALVVGSVLTASFGPFYKDIFQILHRLFPFKRGLSHAYWCPNIWAAYNSLDLILSYVFRMGKSGATSGKVGESSLAVLPQVHPVHTFLLTIFFMTPILWKLWNDPSSKSFISAITLTAWTSVMFGYHVHEKAILNVIIPFSLIAMETPNLYLLTLTAGTISLFPLLFTPFEIALKAIVTVFHLSLACQIIPISQLRLYERLYIFGFLAVYAFENLGHVITPKYPFFPLIIVSDYTLIGIAYCYTSLYFKFMNESMLNHSRESYNRYKTTAKNENTSPRILRARKLK